MVLAPLLVTQFMPCHQDLLRTTVSLLLLVSAWLHLDHSKTHKQLGTALLWADFVFTFSKEVRCIWGARFTGATVVYLCTRYAALIAQIYFVLTVFLWNSTNKVIDSRR